MVLDRYYCWNSNLSIVKLIPVTQIAFYPVKSLFLMAAWLYVLGWEFAAVFLLWIFPRDNI
jgi:hypothetical protein